MQSTYQSGSTKPKLIIVAAFGKKETGKLTFAKNVTREDFKIGYRLENYLSVCALRKCRS